MKSQFRYRIRKKGSNYALEELEGSKIRKSLTLNPEKLWILLNVSDTKKENVSNPQREENKISPQKFVESLLNEPVNIHKSLTPTKEQLEKLFDITSGD